VADRPAPAALLSEAAPVVLRAVVARRPEPAAQVSGLHPGVAMRAAPAARRMGPAELPVRAEAWDDAAA
jgi:hypothetical protein